MESNRAGTASRGGYRVAAVRQSRRGRLGQDGKARQGRAWQVRLARRVRAQQGRASDPRRRPHADLRTPIPARIQDDVRLNNRLSRQWQITRDPALKNEVNRLQRSVTHQLNEWLNEQCPLPLHTWSHRAGLLSQTLRKPKLPGGQS
jgi:hypothetical protein